MCMLWNKQLSIGNTIIDSEHKHLISLANYVERAMSLAMKIKNGLQLQQAFEYLEDELRRHFRNEEKVARAVNLPFAKHMQAQQHMLDEIRFLKEELMAKDCIWTDAAVKHFSEFIDNLIIEHITNVDQPLKLALGSYDYDYWPDMEKSMDSNRIQPWKNNETEARQAAMSAA